MRCFAYREEHKGHKGSCGLEFHCGLCAFAVLLLHRSRTQLFAFFFFTLGAGKASAIRSISLGSLWSPVIRSSGTRK